ncbi:D-xylose transporter subunit XylF, partial [Escherichia coli]
MPFYFRKECPLNSGYLKRLPVVTVIAELPQLRVSGFPVMHQIHSAVSGLSEVRHQERIT